MEPTPIIQAGEASDIAVHKAQGAAQAVEIARQAQNAELLQQMAVVAEAAVIKALNRGETDKRYIDTSRIPFLCDEMRELRKSVQELTASLASFPIIKLVVFSFVGAILLGVLGVAGTAITIALQHGIQ